MSGLRKHLRTDEAETSEEEIDEDTTDEEAELLTQASGGNIHEIEIFQDAREENIDKQEISSKLLSKKKSPVTRNQKRLIYIITFLLWRYKNHFYKNLAYKSSLNMQGSYANLSNKIWIFWRADLNCANHVQMLTYKLTTKDFNKEFYISIVYAKTRQSGREEQLWGEMRAFASTISNPWAVISTVF
ncbi:hypothetical protein KY285_030944 [Solanum tuberosum]|nr:hypothetical protein KY285_030944 [Solanum tuberosum]